MIEMIFAFAGILLMIAIMSVGIVFGRQPIRGSCGGIGADGNVQPCMQCGRTLGDCADDQGARTPTRLSAD